MWGKWIQCTYYRRNQKDESSGDREKTAFCEANTSDTRRQPKIKSSNRIGCTRVVSVKDLMPPNFALENG